MKLFLITRKATWCEDYEMVVVAEDARHAERRARWTSYDFEHEKNIKVKEIKLNKEQVVSISNIGG